MSPDTNNNVENEDNDETSEEEEEEEDEPLFKFSSITASSGLRKTTENVKNLTEDFSCIAVHEKFLAIGKPTGEILITDHLGHIIPQYQIKAHTYPVNAISIDDNGEFMGSCCQEGKVKISSLLGEKDDPPYSFSRPIKAICLEPNYATTKRFITGDTSLVLNEKRKYRKDMKKTLLDLRGGLIHTLRWKETLIAFANDKGVGIYDLRAERLIGLEETAESNEQPRGIYPSRISWNDPTTLSVVCAKTVKILKVVTETTQERQGATPSRSYINTVLAFKIEFYACGLTTVNRDLVVLGIEQYSQNEGTADLSLTLLGPKDRSYEEKAHDAFHMFREERTAPFQFQLEFLPGEQSYFILSPFDIVKAERRDYDDHIDYLLGRNLFTEAIQAFEKPPSLKDKPHRHTQQSVHRAYVKYLIEQNDTGTAVKLFSRVYTTVEEWEEQILNFTQRNQLDIIAPYIPISPLQLNSQTYEKVLLTYLQHKKYDKLKELLLAWPSMIYDVNLIDQQIRLQTNEGQTVQALLECLAILAEKQGNVIRTLDIYLQMGNIQVFQLIERKKLQGDILSKLDVLMAIDQKLTLDILINHMDKLPVQSVCNVLDKSPRYLHAYLDAVFTKNSSDCRNFHTRQVTLYADYEPDKLMRFLRRADNYNLQEALSICEKKQLYREQVFLLGRAGNGRVALQIILVKLNDIEEAIKFCRETGDQSLWPILVEESASRPEFIRGLMNHAGSDINLQQLVQKIRSDLRIPGLRDSLCKIMQDYNIQMSLSECCRKIIVHDCLALRRRTVSLLQSGYPIKDTDSCAKCHNPLYSPDALTNAPVSVFFCLHVFHAKCADTNPDVCSVCSTSTVYTTA